MLGEEGGGGKIILLKEGVFDDVDVVMMLYLVLIDVLNVGFNVINM